MSNEQNNTFGTLLPKTVTGLRVPYTAAEIRALIVRDSNGANALVNGIEGPLRAKSDTIARMVTELATDRVGNRIKALAEFVSRLEDDATYYLSLDEIETLTVMSRDCGSRPRAGVGEYIFGGFPTPIETR